MQCKHAAPPTNATSKPAGYEYSSCRKSGAFWGRSTARYPPVAPRSGLNPPDGALNWDDVTAELSGFSQPIILVRPRHFLKQPPSPQSSPQHLQSQFHGGGEGLIFAPILLRFFVCNWYSTLHPGIPVTTLHTAPWHHPPSSSPELQLRERGKASLVPTPIPLSWRILAAEPKRPTTDQVRSKHGWAGLRHWGHSGQEFLRRYGGLG